MSEENISQYFYASILPLFNNLFCYLFINIIIVSSPFFSLHFSLLSYTIKPMYNWRNKLNNSLVGAPTGSTSYIFH